MTKYKMNEERECGWMDEPVGIAVFGCDQRVTEWPPPCTAFKPSISLIYLLHPTVEQDVRLLCEHG